MINKPKAKSLKCKIKTQSLKFLVLNFSFALFALYSVLLAPQVYAQSIPSSELISNAKEYDGKIVTYTGEAIGDVMVRGSYAWININDGENAIGVWLTKDLIGCIKYTGNYKTMGDRLEVAGIFHRSCPEHGADLDIHAQGIKILAAGQETPEIIQGHKAGLALLLVGLLCLVLISRRLKVR